MPPAIVSNYGKLVFKKISENADETKALAFLKKLFKNASDEKLVEFIHSLPAVLSRKMPLETAQKLIARLEIIGITAYFIPHKDICQPIEKKKEKVVSADQSEPSLSAKDIQNEILTLFQNDIVRFKTSFLYKASLMGVAFAMILLPLIYLAIIFGVLYLILWHAAVNITIFSPPRNIKGALIFYLSPLLIGSVLIFFMIKPLFARRYAVSKPYRLEPLKEPLLFEVVTRVARTLKAPVPIEIYADLDLNASASFKPGLANFFKNNLTLTLGLPLATGMNISQFSGIIAHELGHFSQSFGMRLSYVIRTINLWFARVVYERDVWDERIDKWAETMPAGIMVIIKMSKAFIWMTRKILWVLMQLGRLISCRMSQQLEFDADRCEAAIVGSSGFESSTKRLVLLTQAYRWAQDALNNVYEEGKLVDNFPGLVAAQANQTTPKIRQKIKKLMIEEVETNLWDTHPAHKARIAAARQLDLPPGLKTEHLVKAVIKAKECIDLRTLRTHYDNIPPASFLFNDFNQLACDVSYEFYCGRFGENVAGKQLETVDRAVKKFDAEIDCRRAIDTFLKGQFNVFRPIGLHLRMLTPPQNLETSLQKIASLRKKAAAASHEYNGIIIQFTALHKRLIELSQAALMTENEQKIIPENFNLPSADMSTIVSARRRAEQTFAELIKALDNMEKNTSALIIESLRLLFDASMEESIKNVHAAREAVQQFVRAAAWIERHYFSFYLLEVCAGQLNTITYTYTNLANKDTRLIDLLNQRRRDIISILKDIKTALAKIDHPFTHQVKNLSLGDYLIHAEPYADSEAYEIITIAYETLSRVYHTYARIAGRLIYLAEMVVNVADKKVSTPINFPLDIITTTGEDQEVDDSQVDMENPQKRYQSLLKEALENTRKALSPAPRSFSVMNKIYNHIRRPSWMQKDDPLHCIYKDQNLLLAEGRIVWGQIVQANALLFMDRSEDCPAAILFTTDPAIDGDPEKLQKIAEKLYSLKGNANDNEELNRVAQAITDEYTTLMNYHIPDTATGSIAVIYTTIMVHRKHLPLNYLNSPWFPLLIHPTKTKGAMILPSKYWDAKLVEIWCRS